MRAKIALSRCVNRSVAWSSFCTCSSIRRTAKSSRGFSGPGGFTASLMRFVNGCCSSLLVSHFFANLSDNYIPPKTESALKLSYTLLTWLNYACIYVQLYDGLKVVFCFNFRLTQEQPFVVGLDKNV